MTGEEKKKNCFKTISVIIIIFLKIFYLRVLKKSMASRVMSPEIRMSARVQGKSFS